MQTAIQLHSPSAAINFEDTDPVITKNNLDSTNSNFLNFTLSTNNDSINQRTALINIFDVTSSNKDTVDTKINVKINSFNTNSHLFSFVLSPLNSNVDQLASSSQIQESLQ